MLPPQVTGPTKPPSKFYISSSAIWTWIWFMIIGSNRNIVTQFPFVMFSAATPTWPLFLPAQAMSQTGGFQHHVTKRSSVIHTVSNLSPGVKSITTWESRLRLPLHPLSAPDVSPQSGPPLIEPEPIHSQIQASLFPLHFPRSLFALLSLLSATLPLRAPRLVPSNHSTDNSHHRATATAVTFSLRQIIRCRPAQRPRPRLPRLLPPQRHRSPPQLHHLLRFRIPPSSPTGSLAAAPSSLVVSRRHSQAWCLQPSASYRRRHQNSRQ